MSSHETDLTQIRQTSMKPHDITERTFSFAVRVLKLVRSLPKDQNAYILAKQLARSGTSVGANVEEAQAAHSKRDFVRRMTIALAECRESHYWLRLLRDAEVVEASRLAKIIEESNELVSILTAITKKARANLD